MKIKVSGCKCCGAPLPLAENQFVTDCRYCSNKYYVVQDSLPAVVLEPQVEKNSARDLVLKALRDKEISSNFLNNSFFERAVLYYIPYFEVRGIKAGFTSQSNSKPQEYNYIAYDYLERANDLNDLAIGFFNDSIIEEAILNSEQIPFNPVEMRKNGMVIPPENLNVIARSENPYAREAVENYHRLIYFPIWEISYSYKGIIFKCYVSAIDGQAIKIQGIRCHKKKLKMAMFGLLSLAIILGRGINSGKFGLITAAVFGLPFAAILFPYFWEIYAFQEIVERRGGSVNYQTINYTENSFIKFSRKLVDNFTKIFGIKTEGGGEIISWEKNKNFTQSSTDNESNYQP